MRALAIRTLPFSSFPLVLLPLAALLVAAAGAAGPAMQPRDPDQRPETRVNDCAAGGCHARETEFRFLHAPVAVGACDVCHVYDDPARHTFTLKHVGAALCDFCHIGKSASGDPALGRKRSANGRGASGGSWIHIHEPVVKGECTACHNPHGSNIRRLISANSVGQMCLSCHESVAGHSHNHTPVAEGDCTSCHRPHSSIVPNLLIEEGRDLCLRCHQNTLTVNYTPHAPPAAWNGSLLMPRSGNLLGFPPAPMGFIHEPVLEDCTQCHDHHGTAHAGLLKHDTVSLCASCHEDVISTALNSRVQHSSVMKDKACLNCHSPHQSMHTHLLRSRPVEMCLDCHSTDITRTTGTKIAGMASLLESGQLLHGPLADGHCRGCHQVHGAAQASLLSAHYSTELYQAFSVDAYALCFTCHDTALVREQKTSSATMFRNGEQNLHFIHLAAQDESGRSCRLCHAPHAGKAHPRLLDKVQYGAWTLPMEFKATDTGGSCGAGCHRGRQYDRERAVSNER